MKKVNSDWNIVTPSRFMPHIYKAHKVFDQTIRNYLKSVDIDRALEKARQEAAKEESEPDDS
jgi:hypothetical protein